MREVRSRSVRIGEVTGGCVRRYTDTLTRNELSRPTTSCLWRLGCLTSSDSDDWTAVAALFDMAGKFELWISRISKTPSEMIRAIVTQYAAGPIFGARERLAIGITCTRRIHLHRGDRTCVGRPSWSTLLPRRRCHARQPSHYWQPNETASSGPKSNIAPVNLRRSRERVISAFTMNDLRRSSAPRTQGAPRARSAGRQFLGAPGRGSGGVGTMMPGASGISSTVVTLVTKCRVSPKQDVGSPTFSS